MAKRPPKGKKQKKDKRPQQKAAKKNVTARSQQKVATTAKPKPKTYTSKLVFRTIQEPQADLWRKVFLGLSAVALVTTILLSLGSGINGDDYFQNIYSDKVLSFYSSMGQDTSTFEVPRGIIKIYGGLFEIATASTNAALGNEVVDESYHDVRHVWNALFGFLAMLFTGLIAQKIGGWRAGVIALAFIFLTPRFLGHSLMNPKDIPFAAGYTMAIYFMLFFIQQLPKPNWKTMLGLSLGIGIAFGIRVGGILLVAYLGLFVGLAYLLKNGIPAIWQQGKSTLTAIGWSALTAIAGLGLGLLAWPYGLIDPLTHIPEALGGFTQFAVGIKMLFRGEMVFGNQAPISYLPTWLLNTLPLFILLGFLLFIIFSKKIFQTHSPFYLFITLFTFLFPIVFVMAQGSTLYDGWRHLLFSYPPLVATTAIAWNTVIRQFESKKAIVIGVVAVLSISMIEPMTFILRNPKYPYIYFNPIAGGIKGAFGEFETDYWGVSVKQGLDWMEKEGIIGENMTDTITIISNFSDALDKYAKKKYNGKVRTGYARYRQRYDKNWDYGLFASRFVPGSFLNQGTWPPNDKTIHTVNANGVPLLAILKSEDDIAFRGVQAAKKQNWEAAIPLLEQETSKNSSNEVAWTELGRAYLQTTQLDKALNAINKALAIEPENLQATNLLALYYLRSNQVPAAQDVLLKSLEFEPRNSIAYYYLAIIDQNSNNLSGALTNALQAIEVNKKFKEGYQLAAQIYEKMGDSQNAARYMQAFQTLSGQ